MKYDLYRFTKFGFKIALLSLIPVVPAWTMFPGILFAGMIGKITGNCELSYLITLWGSFALAIGLLVSYFKKFEIDDKTDARLRKEYVFISFVIYSLINTGFLIVIVGTNLSCEGDGQTALAFFYSGPLASIALILVGFVVDVKVSIIAARGNSNQTDEGASSEQQDQLK